MKILNLFFLLALSYNICSAQSLKEQTEQKLQEIYPDSSNIEFKKITLDRSVTNPIEKLCRQKFFRNELYSWKISANDSTIAYAFLDNVIGKTQPISFLVIINKQGKIHLVHVIKYRSEHGSEVTNQNWLDQFKRHNANSGFHPGKDIDGISGATYSVNGLSKGVRKIVLLFDRIKSDF